MKRTVTSLIAVGSMSAAATAHAQSSVTLYGIVDAGIAYVHKQRERVARTGARW